MPIDDAGLGVRARQIRLTAISLAFVAYHIAATVVRESASLTLVVCADEVIA